MSTIPPTRSRDRRGDLSVPSGHGRIGRMWFLRRPGTSRLVGRRALVPAVVGSVLLALSGCTFPGSGPDAEDTADRLASGLASGDLDKVDFTDSAGQARTSYAKITDGVGAAKVSVGKVSTDGDQGKVTLKWSRDVGSKTWSYETEATLHKGADAQGDQAWLVDWAPRIVESSLKDRRAAQRDLDQGPSRGDPRRGRRADRGPTSRAACGHRQDRSGGARDRSLGRPAGPAGRHRPQALRQAGRRRGAEGVRAGHRLPPQRGAGRGARRRRRHPGSTHHRGQAAAGARQGLRLGHPRQRRACDRRAGQGEQGTDPGG